MFVIKQYGAGPSNNLRGQYKTETLPEPFGVGFKFKNDNGKIIVLAGGQIVIEEDGKISGAGGG